METSSPRAEDAGTSKELERQIRDLAITTRAKDYFIEQLQTDRTKTMDQLVGMSRYVGELETQLLQLGGAPRGDRSLPQDSKSFRGMRKDSDREAENFSRDETSG